MGVLEQFLARTKEMEYNNEVYFSSKPRESGTCLAEFLGYGRNDVSKTCIKFRINDNEISKEHKETIINIDKGVSVIEIINENGLKKGKYSITIDIS